MAPAMLSCCSLSAAKTLENSRSEKPARKSYAEADLRPTADQRFSLGEPETLEQVVEGRGSVRRRHRRAIACAGACGLSGSLDGFASIRASRRLPEGVRTTRALRIYRARLRFGHRGHSGGSSSKTRFQITAARRVATRFVSAPTPASRPDHMSRFTNGLSFICSDSTRSGAAHPPRPPQIISTISALTWSNSASGISSPLKIHWVSTCSTRP